MSALTDLQKQAEEARPCAFTLRSMKRTANGYAPTKTVIASGSKTWGEVQSLADALATEAQCPVFIEACPIISTTKLVCFPSAWEVTSNGTTLFADPISGAFSYDAGAK